MPANQGAGNLMKIGVILAAVIIVLRIILEQFGAPEWINNIFGVAWLYFVFPVLFALRSVAGGKPSPFMSLVKNVALFALYTRVMVMVTYMAAYYFQWRAPRFSDAMGGNVGASISPLTGLVVIPLRNFLIWVIGATIIGMIIGGITLLVRKKPVPAA
jgi:hypothetical protein